MTDPDFVETVRLPDLSAPEVVEHRADERQRALSVRYVFVGHLDPIAKRVVGARTLSWLQTLVIDTVALTGRLTMAVEADPKRVRGDATVALAAVGTATRRLVSGEFVVGVPLIGRTAERSILPGLLRRLDVEAAALTASFAAP